MEIKIKQMKRSSIFLSILITIIFLVACSQSSQNSNSNSVGDGKGGSLATFILKGAHLYTVDHQNLSVFNITEVNNPVKVNEVNVGFDIETLFNFNEYLFIGSRTGMFIYDVSNPELPKKMSEVRHFRSCDPVIANDSIAYVTLHSNSICGGSLNELQTYNIKDITNPILLNTRILKQPKGLTTFDKYLFVCDDDVKIFDVSDPNNSIYISSIALKNSLDLIVINNRLFIITENSIIQYLLDKNDIKKSIKLGEFVV